MSTLLALSPLDGRYASSVEPLRPIFSEYGLMKARVKVELFWLQSLADNPAIAEVSPLDESAKTILSSLADEFSVDDAARVKEIERTSNHDVKAIEYFLKEKFAQHDSLKTLGEFIHFACTSEDINNLSHALMLKNACDNIILPQIESLIATLTHMAHQMSDAAMMCRTHGQSATPSTMGKEIANVLERLKRQAALLAAQTFLGKINGAVGNYNAHTIAYPEVDWPQHCEMFVTHQLKLTFNPYTTQIEPHDYMAEFFHTLSRIATLLIDFNRDIWGYISLGYFKQKVNANEVGSSTMPHKVNPIDFENSEGNLGMAHAMLNFMADKLPISRWQRDLSDSTVLRNMGVGVGYLMLGISSHQRGLAKLQLNQAVISQDLDNAWELLAEPIQTLMRRYGIEKPYEKLKDLTRGKDKIEPHVLHDFIQSLDIPSEAKARLLNLTPATYLGYAADLAQKV